MSLVPAQGQVREHVRHAHTKAQLFTRRRVMNGALLALGDVIALEVAFSAAGALRAWLFNQPMLPSWSGVLIVTWLLGAFLLKLLPSWGVGAAEELRRVTGMLALTFGVTVAAIFLLGQSADSSRVALVVGALFAWPLVLLARYGVRHVLIRARLWGVPAVVYGAHESVVQALQETPSFGYVPVGVFDDERRGAVRGVPVLGSTAQVSGDAPIAVVAMPALRHAELAPLLEGPLGSYRKVVVLPEMAEVPSLWATSVDLGGVLGLELTRNLLDPTARFLKRAFDLLLVVGSAPVWVPVCALVALLIWLEDRQDPVFRQERLGEHGRVFSTWKFRTMVPNAEAVLRQRLAEDAALRAEWEAHFKLQRDPRVTRVGRWLRVTSLDELPQLLNVLRGEMSLVGPRPLPAYHEAQLVLRARMLRSQVQPGLTGLWQVSGRSLAGNAGMERWDPYYVQNWSIWLDLVILARTARVVLTGSGAF
ncbi:exopolysaccharide biosynthesis polyprenyl glycosylphosphotransferase [Deinococcus maricopensis]|uniref:Exopolysaccharide biosynthesis polyprenyl glycosylphosphotransferase n=1 Tax=Deinococcus maricopensis (strain DSM 21211 / LMG 22137 / NRRL B-23946 / LB-34) TaxID=709986 RepID=E8U3E6_DEIML|nr:exopolysaccharide biosynthesis polyprenyl glycosylphosphotransferase [Deinococcus maricopensis]ADV65817.1 exopolysaccharide biosynthesis polyprenyl glycosylphosphotransferase [Deinococcus maricopensis DSM 21211]